MADNRINIVIQATDKASPEINRVTSSLDAGGKKWVRTGAIMGAAAGVVQSAVTRAMDAVTQFIDGAVERVDTLNNFPRIMQNFGVGAGDATTMIKALDKGVRGLPTTLNDIAALAEGFVPVTKNTEEATKTALALNNAVLAGGAPMQVQTAALEQFRQALSKGKPDLQDWKTIEMAMPAQLRQIAVQLGIGSGKLKDYRQNGLGLYEAMKDGWLTMDDFNQALIKLNESGSKNFPSFEKQAKNATQGIGTGFTNMRTAITRGVADIIQSIGSVNISNFAAGFGKAIEDVLKTVGNLIGSFKEMGAAIGDYLGPKFENLWISIQQNLMPILTDLWHNVIEPLLPVLGTLLVGAIGAVIDITKGLSDGIGWVYKQMKDGNPLVWALVGLFGSLATAMAFNAVFDALTVGFAKLTLVTIPSVMTSVETLQATISSPTTFGAISVAAAIAALAAIYQAANDAHDAVQGAQDAATQSDQTTREILKNLKKRFDEGKMTAEDYQKAVDTQTRIANKELADRKAEAQSNFFTPMLDSIMNISHLIKTGVWAPVSSAGKRTSGSGGGGFASGTPYAPGGLTLVGERGPELVNLPRGSQVSQAWQTRSAASQGVGGGDRNAPIVGEVHVHNEVDLKNLLSDIGWQLRAA